MVRENASYDFNFLEFVETSFCVISHGQSQNVPCAFCFFGVTGSAYVL